MAPGPGEDVPSPALERPSDSPAQTEAIGAELAAGLSPGDVLLVGGELGAGKTTLVRGACRALGYEGPVTSPTFTIGQRYEGRLPLSHLDLYRLEGLAGEDPGLLDDYLTPRSVGFVEWPGRAPELEAMLLEGVRLAATVEIEHTGAGERAVRVHRQG